MPKYIAHFTPEAWINDYATEVDPEGPQEWDCTAYAREYAGYLGEMQRLDQTDSFEGVLDRDDFFKDDPAAPEWVRDWRGPFTIRIREAT